MIGHFDNLSGGSSSTVEIVHDLIWGYNRCFCLHFLVEYTQLMKNQFHATLGMLSFFLICNIQNSQHRLLDSFKKSLSHLLG